MDSFFVESLDLREHPLKHSKPKIRAEYYTALSYMVKTTVSKAEVSETLTYPIKSVVAVLRGVTVKRYALERLSMYRLHLSEAADDDIETNVTSVSSWLKKPWRKKFRLLLVSDLALVLLNKEMVLRAVSILQTQLSSRQIEEMKKIVELLFEGHDASSNYGVLCPLDNQFRLNADFAKLSEKRIIVTANMSAGKSTLINAIVGKPVARTSQEVCTGNVCYLYNKPFDDGNVHLAAQGFTFKATPEELHNYDWNEQISIAAHFTKCTEQIKRLCIIDTPGVDAALHQEHGNLTHNALKSEKYDVVLSVVCPTQLGTDAERKHLLWLRKNLPDANIIFVLNKLDNYRDCSDSIEESVAGLKRDLIEIGFVNPVVCPISAYFAYLLKMKITGQKLSEDEEDEYAYLTKKFMRSSYDLSHYYEDVAYLESDSVETTLSKRAGLYGLEKIIYGG